MDPLTSLSVFVRVVDLGSFAAAGRALGLSPSMVGNHVRALEARVAAPLLLRTTRQQSLTDAGAELLQRARGILEAMSGLDQMADRTADLAGPLRLSAPLGIGRHWVAPALRHFLHAHPGLEIDLQLSDQPKDLLATGLDLVVRNGPLLGSQASLVARVVARQSLILAAAPDYLAAAGAPARLDDLLRHRTLRYSRDGRARPWLFPTADGMIQLDPPTGFMADDIGTLCDAALEGAGICWLPDWLLRPHLAAGRLVPVLADQPALGIDVFLVRPNAPYPPRKLLLAADFLAQAIARQARA